ncbi:MAG TPA: tyrosine-type recombinase/integrase [Pyrinomonadaceae bacterium]|jgi:integrase/recombinase XerC
MPSETPAVTSRDAGAGLTLRFDPRTAIPFCEKSVSEETRRAYRRVVKEFFHFVGGEHPSLVTPDHVLRWRESLKNRKRRSATISFKLSVVRSFFEYLRAGGHVQLNPAATKVVSPPAVSDEMKGRALTAKEVRYLLSGPNRETAEGARDYALMLVMLKLGVRVSEACSLRASSVHWSHGRWVVKFKVKGGRERTLPLPQEVRKAIDEYLKLDAKRRKNLKSDGAEAYLFQPHTNYRTLQFDKALSTRMAWNVVRKWGEFTGVGKLSPHDLRRTAITKALDQGLSYRQVQMMSGHKDPKTVMRYDHGRENLEQNAVNFISYGDD